MAVDGELPTLEVVRADAMGPVATVDRVEGEEDGRSQCILLAKS